MGHLHALRNRVVDAPGSLGARTRARRWDTFRTMFPDIGEMSVLDLGGTVDAWLRAPVRPAFVQVVNLEPATGPVPEWLAADMADACDLPERLRRRRYDLVFSNSVLEHVGGHERRSRFADNVHALAYAHWVQTPYRYFPIEPHWLFPGMQFLPARARAEIARRWPLAHSPSADAEGALRSTLWVELLSVTEMRHYFPQSAIRYERIAGLVKSLIAVRDDG